MKFLEIFMKLVCKQQTPIKDFLLNSQRKYLAITVPLALNVYKISCECISGQIPFKQRPVLHLYCPSERRIIKRNEFISISQILLLQQYQLLKFFSRLPRRCGYF